MVSKKKKKRFIDVLRLLSCFEGKTILELHCVYVSFFRFCFFVFSCEYFERHAGDTSPHSFHPLGCNQPALLTCCPVHLSRDMMPTQCALALVPLFYLVRVCSHFHNDLWELEETRRATNETLARSVTARKIPLGPVAMTQAEGAETEGKALACSGQIRVEKFLSTSASRAHDDSRMP